MSKATYGLGTPLHFKSAEEYFPARGTIRLEVIVHPRQGTALNQPENVKKANSKEWPIEPPAVVKLVPPETSRVFLNNSPNLFCIATLNIARTNNRHEKKCSEELDGNRVVSLTKLKRTNTFPDEFGVFVFSDLKVQLPGEYYLDFSLFEMVLSDNGMCAMHLTSENSQKFTIFSKANELARPVESPIVKELSNQGIKIRTRKIGKVNKKPKQGWECTLDQVRGSVDGLPFHLSQSVNPYRDDFAGPSQMGMLDGRRTSDAVPFRYPPTGQASYHRSPTDSFNSVVAANSMAPPLSTPTHPMPASSNAMVNYPATSSNFLPSLTSMHIEGSGHGVWNHNGFASGYPMSTAFNSHSMNESDFNSHQTANNNLAGHQIGNPHNMQAGGYAVGSNPFAPLQLDNTSAHGHINQKQLYQPPTHHNHESGAFNSNHSRFD